CPGRPTHLHPGASSTCPVAPCSGGTSRRFSPPAGGSNRRWLAEEKRSEGRRRRAAALHRSEGIGITSSMYMLGSVLWMFGLGWPTRISSAGGILVQKESKSNISDTQTATFEFPEFPVVWCHRTYGASADPDYPWGATIYGEKGTLKLSVQKYEFFPLY